MSLLSAVTAAAQSGNICDELHGRLADVPETISTSHDARQYSSAIADQNEQMRQLESDFNDRGCAAPGSVIQDPNAAVACEQMETSLDRMHENLRYLMARSQSAHDHGGSDIVLRDQILAALQQNGCDRPASSDIETITNRSDDVTPEQQGMRTDTFIPPMGVPSSGDGGEANASVPAQPYNGDGASVRTVCVRTCDGGFFPMTANATPVDFQRDADTCARMCPGVPTELFFHYLPSQETTEMISATSGTPYGAMPYAFAYRKRAPGEKSSCSCDLNAYFNQLRQQRVALDPLAGGRPNSRQSSITRIETGKPTTTPPAAAITPPAAANPEPPAEAEKPYDPATSKVRQVGPQFLATDNGKIDLRHPAAPGPQPEQ